ncbi:hypothetical protein MMC13_003050 [Lambiella insularis]|nr:hypothetical protein [Lambiella insularis]
MTLTIKARPSATNALQQRVTALDRSTEKASAQISEAFSLLAINLDNTTTRFSPESSEEERRRGFGPKEEWVLRWLLKRIDGDTVQAERQDRAIITIPAMRDTEYPPTAWILLKILVARLSTAVVARHLSAFKFIVAFERTLGRLSVLAHGIQLPMDSVNSGPPVQALVSRENSSSSTVQESPFVVNQNSKKRKRDTESSVNNAVSMSAKHLRRLYLSICGAVSQVEEHTVSASGGADEFAAEHMKAAMKTSVEQSAKILGNALQVLKYILMIPGDDTRTWETCDYDYVLKPLINIWNLRSSLEDAHNGPLSARAFSESCLLPALVLVMKLGSSPDEVADKTSLSQRILPLLAAHIILPGRAGFMAVKDQKLDANSTSLVSELLAPIAKSLHELSSVDANIGLLKNAIPVLFEFAVHLMPRNTPKQRLIEGLWLRALFVQLAGCLFTQFPIPINVSEDDLNTYILERMLQIVVHNKLSLEVSILQNIILNISGVHRARPQHRAWWGLVGLSIKINPDVALPIRTNSNSRATGTTKPSNVVLEKILTKLTSSGFKFGSRYSDDYENMLHHVILPILESFIRARDLEGFIDVLKQRLSIWDSRGELENNSQQCPDNAVSIWEDEALLHSISSNLESALTAGQISRMLQHITVTIDGLSIPLSREEQSKLYAELVIIDTVISGISDDQTLSKCKEPVRSINHTLSAFLMNDAILPDGHRWLVWRALATITAHFPYCTEDCVRKAQEQQILGLTRQPQFTIRPAQWQETLFALRYIIGSCQGQGHSGPIGITSVVMTSVVNAIANAMAATFSENHISTESQAASRGYYAWDGKVETVTNTETLLVACAAQLILVTQCLVVIEPAVLAEFTEQLYQQAAMHAHWSQSLRICSSETNFIGFGTLWESFILTGTTGEYPSIAKVIRKTVLKSFLDAEELNGPRDDSQCSQFAVIAIHQLSLGSFEYDERKEILDRTCIKVLQNPDLRHGDQYLALLEHSLDHPKKSMRIKFSESSFLWQLADVLDSSKTSLSQDGVLITFRQLVAKTISFIIEHDKNDQYTSFSDSFLDILATRVAALDAASIAPANTIMVLVCLVTVWNRSPTMPARMSRGTLSITEISREILQWLPNILATYQGELDSWQINVVHDSLETYLSMIGAGLDQSASVAGRLRSEIIRNCQSIKDLASNGIWDAKSDSVNTYTIEDLLVTVKKVETSLASDGSAISALGIHALEDCLVNITMAHRHIALDNHKRDIQIRTTSAGKISKRLYVPV